MLCCIERHLVTALSIFMVSTRRKLDSLVNHLSIVMISWNMDTLYPSSRDTKTASSLSIVAKITRYLPSVPLAFSLLDDSGCTV